MVCLGVLRLIDRHLRYASHCQWYGHSSALVHGPHCLDPKFSSFFHQQSAACSFGIHLGFAFDLCVYFSRCFCFQVSVEAVAQAAVDLAVDPQYEGHLTGQ